MVAQDPTTVLSTNSAEDVAMVRKTIATMTVIDDPGDPDVMLPDLGMSSSSSGSSEGAFTKRDDDVTDVTRDDATPTRETIDDTTSRSAGQQQEMTQHTRNTLGSGHTRESSAHSRATMQTRETMLTRETMQTTQTTQTKQTAQTQETYHTYHTQGDESAFTFESFATTGCETIGDASVEMKNALIYIQESVGKCLGVDIASEVKASMGEVEQTTAEIVEDRKEIWHVLLDQVEDHMIEQLGDHWLETPDEESKRRERERTANKVASSASSSSSRRKKNAAAGHRSSSGSGGERVGRSRVSRSRSKPQKRRENTENEIRHTEKVKRGSRERVGRQSASRSRSKPQQQQQQQRREETRDEFADDEQVKRASRTRSSKSPKLYEGIREDIVVDDDEVEKTMLSEIEGVGSYDSPVGERSVLYFAA